jgi:thiamine biosynthesis lipoprotein
MNRAFREIEIWGTVIVVEVASHQQSSTFLEAAIVSAHQYFIKVDELLSPWKSESEVSRLRRGEIAIEDCSAQVQEVWHGCLEARELTTGAFDPWSVHGGFDPSGYVKGWAADKACDFFVAQGIESCLVNAGGDIAVRGGIYIDDAIHPWRIEIRNPSNPAEIIHAISISDGAIATSGTYEKGSHIHDPWNGLIAIGGTSATVWGPNGGVAEAMATALIVSGKDGARWFSQPELANYSAWCIDRGEDTSWSISGADFSN